METYTKYSNVAGIYKFTCIHNDKVYVGKSVNIKRRILQHKHSKTGSYLTKAIVKHGWGSFKIEILEIFENFDRLRDNLHLLDREAYYIELFDSTNTDKGYNICKYSTDLTGIPLSKEHKEKLRLANLGIPFSLKRIENIRQSQMGNTNSKGKKRSEESKEKMRQAKLGKKLSQKTKEKMRLSQSGKVKSEETKEKIRQSKLGKKHSEETKEKMRLSKLAKNYCETL